MSYSTSPAWLKHQLGFYFIFYFKTSEFSDHRCDLTSLQDLRPAAACKPIAQPSLTEIRDSILL
jgi:hypothetical protein